MDMGTLSKMLSEAAGPSLQQECGTKYPQGIQHGEIAVLGGGNIHGVKQVYCVAIPRYDKHTVGSDTPIQVPIRRGNIMSNNNLHEYIHKSHHIYIFSLFESNIKL